ncbi:MAG: response regulator [Deltaproteobacteria bacterium]|nr:response regulator [Deltaproteobacteria bacterium]
MMKKLLVVDDEIAIRNMFQETLRRAGYTVRLAESGEKALEILEKENIQVIFLDLKLPGMNGVDLCRRIRKDKPIAVLYAVTGYASLFDLAECREAGFDDYFIKPVDIEVISKAAQDAFEKLYRWKEG